jgi:hypothetical protein
VFVTVTSYKFEASSTIFDYESHNRLLTPLDKVL